MGSNFYTLIRLLISVVTLCHWIAVLFKIVNIVEIELGETDSWMANNELFDKPFYMQYISALYWSTATVMLIGSSGYVKIHKILKQYLIEIFT